jgi:serine/threonine protein kinase
MAETGRTRIGDFQILEKIGEGSLGTVFKAVCLADGPAPLSRGMAVALKRLHPSADLPRETKALAALTHPHIVRFLSFFVFRPGEWDEAPFLVTELLEGSDLGAHLAAHPEGLPWEEARRILEQTLDALAFAEARGVVHRDLKPSNLFLCADGAVKVIDFGLARKTGGTVSVAAESAARTGLTGTLDYMAPEFARVDGFRGDVLSDLFSFGVLACQTLTGMLPFPPLGEQPEIAFIRRWTGARPPRAMVPRPVAYAWEGAAAFLARAVNLEREARFPSFQAAREALARIRPRVLDGAQERYTLEAFLASGGFCDVFRARSGSGAAVAIKRLHAGRHEWRFRREAGLLQTLQGLNHPALVRIQELIEEPGSDGAPCLVMEYLPGDDLRRRLSALWETGRGLPWREAVRLFIRYLEGLEALHASGIAHRDIKPANLYAPAGCPDEAKLLDLGVACEQDGTVSMQGMAPGTLDYMAPELASGTGGRGTPQSDLFGLGSSLYEALTGHPALKRLPKEDAAAIRALCARSESEEAFSEAFEGFHAPVFGEQPDLAAIVGKAMRFDPACRYGGAEESAGRWTGAGARAMREALQEVLAAGEGSVAGAEGADPAGGEAPAPPTSDRTVTVDGLPPKKRWPFAAILLLALALLAAAGWSLRAFSKKGTPVPPAAPPPARVPQPVPLPVGAAPVAEPRSNPAPAAPAEPVAVPAEAPAAAPEPAPAVTAEAPRVVIRPLPAAGKASAPLPLPFVPNAVSNTAPPSMEPAKSIPAEADLARAEESIRAWRIWLTRLDDPLTSVTLRRFQPNAGKPAWRSDLPYLLAAEREALPAALRGRVERALIWEQAAADLAARKDPLPPAAALRALADRLEPDEPRLAGQCRFEARLLEWSGKGLPADGFPALPEAAIWRAHALAASGDDQDARAVLAAVADYADQRGAELLAEDALLAVRAADLCLARALAEIRDKTAPDVAIPGTGRAVRDPVAAYARAVGRLREQVAGDLRRVLGVAQATGPAAAAEMVARLGRDRDGAAAGDWVWSLPELDATPWREGRKVWAGRVSRLSPDDCAILRHVRGVSPLPGRAEELPVARLRGAP